MINSKDLETGERVIWASRPAPWRYAWVKGWRSLLFAIGGLVFVSIVDWPTAQWGFVTVIFAAIVAFCLSGLLLSPILEYKRAQKTVYMLTDRRAIIQTDARLRARKFIRFTEMNDIRVVRGRGSNGDLILQTIRESSPDGTSVMSDGFIAVDNVDDVKAFLGRAIAQRA